jgi:hypothetical protein
VEDDHNRQMQHHLFKTELTAKLNLDSPLLKDRKSNYVGGSNQYSAANAKV